MKIQVYLLLLWIFSTDNIADRKYVARQANATQRNCNSLNCKRVHILKLLWGTCRQKQANQLTRSKSIPLLKATHSHKQWNCTIWYTLWSLSSDTSSISRILGMAICGTSLWGLSQLHVSSSHTLLTICNVNFCYSAAELVSAVTAYDDEDALVADALIFDFAVDPLWDSIKWQQFTSRSNMDRKSVGNSF